LGGGRVGADELGERDAQRPRQRPRIGDRNTLVEHLRRRLVQQAQIVVDRHPGLGEQARGLREGQRQVTEDVGEPLGVSVGQCG